MKHSIPPVKITFLAFDLKNCIIGFNYGLDDHVTHFRQSKHIIKSVSKKTFFIHSSCHTYETVYTLNESSSNKTSKPKEIFHQCSTQYSVLAQTLYVYNDIEKLLVVIINAAPMKQCLKQIVFK